MRRRLLSLLVAFAMVMSMIPTSAMMAFAEDSEEVLYVELFADNNVCSTGDDATFYVEASGGTEPYTYQWKYTNNEMDEWVVIEDEDWVRSMSGNTLEVTASDELFDNEYLFRCLVTDADGNMCETGHDQLYRLGDEGNGLYVSDLDDISCVAGDTVEFTVEASGGTEPYTYQWYYWHAETDEYIAITDEEWAIGADTATLKVNVSQEMLNLEYRFFCAVTDAEDNYAESYRGWGWLYDANGIGFSETPQSKQYCSAGDTLELELAATGGTAPYEYQWYYGNDSREYVAITDEEWASGADTAKLTINITEEHITDNYWFFCEVTDAEGRSASTGIIHIYDVNSLHITSEMGDVWCYPGDIAEFSVEAAGGTEPYTYQWYYDYDGMDSEEFYPVDSMVWASGADSPVLTVDTTDIDFDLGYRFYCVVTDADGNEVSSDWSWLYEEDSEGGYDYLYEAELEYTSFDGGNYRAYFELDQETMSGEVTIEPYDPNEPVFLTWTKYDGSRESIELEFEDGVATAVIEYESDEAGLLEYTVTVYEPTEPSVGIGFYMQGQEYEVGDPIWFDENGEAEYWLPYTYDRDKSVIVSAVHLDGSYTTHDIVWNEDGTGTVKIASEINGEEKIFTLTVYVSELSSDAGIDAYLNAYNADGNIIDLYIDSDEAASEDEHTVTIPYGSEEVYLYVSTSSEWAAIETPDGDVYEGGETMDVIVSDGDVIEFIVTAQDGTEQEYRLVFAESDGTSTAIKMYADMGMAGDMVDFIEIDGKVVADIAAPYWFDNDEGLYLDWISDEFVSVDYNDEEPIYLDSDDTKTVEFTVTSANGEVTQDYVINITKDQDGSNAELKYIDIYYRGTDDRLYIIEASVDDAASEEGAVVLLPEYADIENSCVDVEIKTLKYAQIIDMNFDAAKVVGGYGDYGLEGFSLDLAKANPSVVTFSVLSPNGENTQDYKLTIQKDENVLATGICGDDLTWVLDIEGTLTISGTGDMYDYEADENGVSTAPWAEYKDDIKTLVIGDGVTRIGAYAFANVYSNDNAVARLAWSLRSASVSEGELVIPDSVKSIGEYAFGGCDKFTGELVLPTGLETIEADAFNGCSGLEGEVKVPATVTEVGARAFQDCGGIDKLTVTNKDCTLGEDCVEAENVTIASPEGSKAEQYAQENNIPTETIEDVTYGDANGDGKVNVKDAVLVLQYANKKITADQLDLTASDVNGDGKVNVKDATMVLQYANKKLDSFPAAK